MTYHPFVKRLIESKLDDAHFTEARAELLGLSDTREICTQLVFLAMRCHDKDLPLLSKKLLQLARVGLSEAGVQRTMQQATRSKPSLQGALSAPTPNKRTQR